MACKLLKISKLPPKSDVTRQDSRTSGLAKALPTLQCCMLNLKLKLAFVPADDAVSAPAAAMMDPDSAAAQSQRRLFEAALKKARPRPLVVSRLRTCGDASGYSSCLSGEAALLSAFCIQVRATYRPKCSGYCWKMQGLSP